MRPSRPRRRRKATARRRLRRAGAAVRLVRCDGAPFLGAGLTGYDLRSYPWISVPGAPHLRVRPSSGGRRVLNTLESEPAVYAIVRAGGRQEKVAVGDVLEIDRLQAEPGVSVDLPVLLLVDGGDVTSDRDALADATVTVEVVGETKGRKIDILKYKNKTGYRRRQGHRQKHTQVRVTGIDTGRDKK